ncbi:MAG: HD domain-containing protein [Gemmatimonadetes bacterium]|nr:HD domain-containing protein [Gemmatimonadota bacterium]
MSHAVRFLHALAHALATMALYSPGHPAGRRAQELALEALRALLAADPDPIFLFLGGPPIYAGRALHELGDWPWGPRFTDISVQRLQFDGGVTPESFAALLEQLQARLVGSDVAILGEVHLPGISFGPVAVEAMASEEAVLSPEAPEEGEPLVSVDLREELEAMRFVLTEARAGRVARAEAEAIARILAGLVEQYLLPQATVTDGGEPAAHAVNTALLTMAAGQRAGLDGPDRVRLGVAALWHDVGMMRLPAEYGAKTSLSPDERRLVERHPVLGAELLLQAGGRGLELSALVAFEHHLRPDGTGYPMRRFGHHQHWASALVGAAAAYTAVRAPRPFRDAWGATRAMHYLESGAGTVFDAGVAQLLAGLVAA